jgi:hypothetical protein
MWQAVRPGSLALNPEEEQRPALMHPDLSTR